MELRPVVLAVLVLVLGMALRDEAEDRTIKGELERWIATSRGQPCPHLKHQVSPAPHGVRDREQTLALACDPGVR